MGLIGGGKGLEIDGGGWGELGKGCRVGGLL